MDSSRRNDGALWAIACRPEQPCFFPKRNGIRQDDTAPVFNQYDALATGMISSA